MTRPLPRAGDEVLVHARVLADPTRLAVLRLLEGAAEPLTARMVAASLGLHPNTARQHLAVLRDGGLAVEEGRQVTGPGRPAVGFRACTAPGPGVVAGALGAAGWDGYHQVVRWLLRVAAGMPARAVGAEAGRRMGATVAGLDSVEVVELAFRLQGFAPDVEREERADLTALVLRACPFAETAVPDPTVCELHLGLAEGLAGAVGTAEVTDLRRARPGIEGCRVLLRATGGTGGRGASGAPSAP